jgi:hypothetical protein
MSDTPTAAAMRAAAELANACFGMRSQRGEPLLAEIVDRTTGLPELIGFARNISETAVCVCELRGLVGFNGPCRKCEADALVAKFEGRL